MTMEVGQTQKDPCLPGLCPRELGQLHEDISAMHAYVAGVGHNGRCCSVVGQPNTPAY